MWSHLKKLDWYLIVSSILLVILGLVSLYSSSLRDKDFLNFNKQIIFFIIGIFLMFLISLLDWRIFKENSYLILIIYLICVILVLGLFFFAPSIRGVRRWYKIAGFTLDPVEAMKLVLIIILAKYFSIRHVEMYNIRHILVSAAYVFLPVILVFFQPDLGSSIILILLWLGILLISGIKIKHLLILIICGILIFTLGWSFFLKDYQKQRVISFIAPHADPLGAGWQQKQSKIAIGSGRIFGQGLGKGAQTQYGFLPEKQTDFIFAAIAEEMGLVGIIIMLSLFLFMIFRITKIAVLAQSNFARLFSSGLVVLFISQIFVNIAMNLGLVPIIGIPLPLISYGGSNLIFTFAALGILQSIKANT